MIYRFPTPGPGSERRAPKPASDSVDSFASGRDFRGGRSESAAGGIRPKNGPMRRRPGAAWGMPAPCNRKVPERRVSGEARRIHCGCSKLGETGVPAAAIPSRSSLESGNLDRYGLIRLPANLHLYSAAHFSSSRFRGRRFSPTSTTVSVKSTRSGLPFSRRDGAGIADRFDIS